MKKEEFVESIFFNGKLVNIGLDDASQSYFIEYVDDRGNLNEESAGGYNTDYRGYIEYALGTPDLREEYRKIRSDQNLSKNNVPKKCPHPHKYGYCDTCDAAYIHYIPLPHQLDVHKDKHKIKLLLGG